MKMRNHEREDVIAVPGYLGNAFQRPSDSQDTIMDALHHFGHPGFDPCRITKFRYVFTS
jgi:hypothetical protein